ncbi:hypothetical protein VE02_00784 [Pseudogymnoascus sp. 03VT05]|nr:hypothetical protein VE02_00784 [Pseudogymnoascus sp. 03VT05]
MSPTWQETARRARAVREACIPEEWILKNPIPDSVLNVMDVPRKSGIMNEWELSITEMDATELLELLGTGAIKSYDLTVAFCKRAAIAQQLLNCLTIIFFNEALERAKELDEIFSKTKKLVGPYHGLPFSIKDHFNIKDKVSSSGYVAWADEIATEDAALVGIIREAGAVLFCKTTNPQTLMHLETNSNIYGRTLNPYNRGLTSGGSSGGEAALVSFYGSPIGLGSDGGGSIRGPAANVGLVGLKQTSGRIPASGNTMPMNGCASFPVVVGPLCRSARDSEFFMKTIIGTSPWRKNPDVMPIPWDTFRVPKKLTIGIYSDDGIVRCHPPITAALKYVTELLRAESDIVIKEWKPYDHARGYDIIRKLYFQDGAADHYKMMEITGEPVLPLSAWVFKDSHTQRRTIEESWALNVERAKYRQEYLDYWNSNSDIDVILCPCGPSAAPRHDTARYWGYTAVFNCLDYPACAFPTGLTVSASDHPVDPSYIPRDNEFDAYNWSQYDPKAYEMAPIGLQLVGRQWECELVIKTVARIEKLLMNEKRGQKVTRKDS